MKAFGHFLVTLILVFTSRLDAAAPEGKTHKMPPLNQVPEGLARSDWAAIRAAYEAGRHAFQPVEGQSGVWQARNPGQQWLTNFDGRGFVAEPASGGWQWGLELISYGFAGHDLSISGPSQVRAEGQRLTYQWHASLEEWFVNDDRGLEHGFTLLERPKLGNAAAAPLRFDLAVRGNLHPTITADSLGVEFRNAQGTVVLTYAGLKVWDAKGKVLPSRFEPGPSGIRLLVDERGAHYPLTIDPIAQQAYLKASNPDSEDYFGHAVAISGDTVVVGAPYEASSTTGVNSTPNDNSYDAGAAYIFVRNAGVWTQQAYLKPAAVGTTQAGDEFGFSVAISGDTVVVGASDEDSSSTGVNSTPNDNSEFGQSGAAYVFVRNSGMWTQQAYLKPASVGETQEWDFFGHAVAVSGDTAVVSAPGEASSTTGVNSTPNENALGSGAVYVFVRSAGGWAQQAYLKPGVNPQDVDIEGHGIAFGWSVAVSGDTVVVGAEGEDSSTTGVNSTPDEGSLDSGAAYVFNRSAGVWTQQAYLKPAAVSTSQDLDNFGHSVAISGDALVVGAPGESSSTTGVNSIPDDDAGFSGAAHVFVRNSGTWTQQAYLKPAAVGTTQEFDYFGESVAISGDTVVVGAPGENSRTTGVNSTPNESADYSGAAYVFARSAGAWTQHSYLKSAVLSTTALGDSFGISVAVSGDTVLVGSERDDSSTTGVNSTPNKSAAESGAAYVFEITATSRLSGPVLTSPGAKASPGATLSTLTPAFVWKAVTGATGYALNITNSLTGLTVYSNESLGAVTSFSLPEDVLIPGFPYFWSVRTRNAGGLGVIASAPFYFSIAENVPLPSKLVALSPGAKTQPGPVIATLTPTFLWKPMTGTLGHALYIVDLGTGTLAYSNDTLGSTGAFNMPAGTLQWGRTYSWTVRARNGAGWGVSSDPFYFQIKSDVVLPNPPPLTAPGGATAPGSVVSHLTPAFTWKPVTGATGYGLYIADVATNQLVYDGDDLPATTSLNLPAGILKWGRAYRWNMRTKTAAGWSAFSSRFFFQTRSDFTSPVISEVTPDVLVGSDSPQTIWISGAGFRTGAQVLLTWPGATEYLVPAAQTKLESDQRIRILVKTGKLTSAWTAKVRNTDLKISAPFTFQVVAPIPGALAAPVPTPAPGAYMQPIFVSLTPPTASGVTMRYALNGTAPDAFSTRYASPFLIGDATNVTVTAQAYSEATVPSLILTARYTFNLPAITLPGSRSGLNGAGNSYTYYKINVPAGLAEMTLSTSGGTGDCDWYLRYNRLPMLNEYDASSRNLGTNSESQILMSPRVGTCYVLVHGAAAYSGVTLTAATKKAVGTTATPTFSLNDGNHAGPIDLRMTCSEPGAEIYYTLDGTEPSLPPLMTGSATNRYIAILPPTLTQPVGQVQTITVKARAIIQGKNPSAVKTGKFTINNGVLELDFDDVSQNGIQFDEAKLPVKIFWANKETVDFEFYFDLPDEPAVSGTSLRYPVALTVNLGLNAWRMNFWLSTKGRASPSSFDFRDATLPFKNDVTSSLYVLGSPIQMESPVQTKGGLIQPGKRYHGLVRTSGINASVAPKVDTEVIFQIHYATLLAPNLVGSPIQSNMNNTWLLAHGRDDMASSPKMYNLAQALATSGQTGRVGQVLRLDWSSMAEPVGPLSKVSLNGGLFIPGVAQRTAHVMNHVLKIRNSQISAVGHSWGSYVAYELGKHSRINRLVALDPATTAFGGYQDSKVNFAAVSNKSWGFVTYYGQYGSEVYASTAKEAFLLNLGYGPTNHIPKHNAPVELFTHLLRSNYDASYFTDSAYQVSRFFTLDRLDDQNTNSFWLPNRYPRIQFGQSAIFEAEFQGIVDEDGFDQFAPLKLFYMPNPGGTELEWP